LLCQVILFTKKSGKTQYMVYNSIIFTICSII